MVSFNDIIFKPERESIRKWGILAHVPEEERNRIFALPAGQYKPAVESLERQIKEYRRKPDTVKRLQYQKDMKDKTGL